MITLVVLSKYQDVFDKFLHHYDRWASNDTPHERILITESVRAPGNWKVVEGPGAFTQPKYNNFAIDHSQGDMFLVSDDVLFTHKDTITILHSVAHSVPQIGALSPIFDGVVAIGMQTTTGGATELSYSQALCYIATYFKRDALKVRWDERFIGYAWEDIDHCMSLQQIGWKLAVTNLVVMKHDEASVTWFRKPQKANGLPYNQNLFEDKWRGKLGFLGKIEPITPCHVVLRDL